jgi:alpha-glucosidase/alpha-D-xyloside xylohydrolase
MRALWISWPQDAKALRIADQYLWGDHFLVAPVLESGATRRRTYLPAGQWWDFWSHQRVEGGAEITREVDLSTIPLYVRAGAIVPMGPVRQYAMEPSEEPVTLHVYPGADGQFSWYDDDGISFGYQQGRFTRIDCTWQDSARELTLTWVAGKRPLPLKAVRIQAMDTGMTKVVSPANHLTVIEL